ncbi:MAG: hypothetical protein JNK24_08140 [Alphaproteobacteria bacterium]|nr:hypothetical protein [Alphaproteobacteria bacterium]
MQATLSGDLLNGENMIEQTPPDIMTTEERLSEIASLLARACERLRERAKLKGYTRLTPYISGLHAERKCNHYLR